MSKISHSFLYIILLSLNLSINGFNLSPKPNIIIREPINKYPFMMPKLRSSYFGFSLNLRTTSIIVGAPRAQSTLESQTNLNETGAIYKCSLKPGGICQAFVFDPNGNTEGGDNEFTSDSEKKDFQWLGASMDGGPNDSDRLIVCAPRLLANFEDVEDIEEEYHMHGICYCTTDTLGDKPSKVRKISPLRLKKDQYKKSIFYHIYGEQGISVHIAINNNTDEIIIGAPGIHTWKGSIIRYKQKKQGQITQQSKRDIRRSRVNPTYSSDIPNPELWGQTNDSYFGYAVSSGYFDSAHPYKLYYVATAPQANEQAGEAYIFDLIKTNSGEQSITKHHTFRGNQFGEYFGYAVLSEDLNGDKIPDLIISAPQYSENLNYDKGAIYVFINKGRLTFELQAKIVCLSNAPARFGTTLSKLGDINHDGYLDIAVGAPFQGNGAVYVYLGGPYGLQTKPSQIIKSPLDKTLVSVPLQAMFGHGLSRGSDIDANGFNDLAIGAPNSEMVYLYRAYPVVKIIASINSLTRELQPNDSKFDIRVCYQISTTASNSENQDVIMKVKVDPHVKRVTLVENGLNQLDFNVSANALRQCRTLKATVKFTASFIFNPVELELQYTIAKGIPNSEVFCETCAAVDPADPVLNSDNITFSTGCKSTICVADLRVSSSSKSPIYILGIERTLTIKYDIENVGETAYLPQINIFSSNRLPFAKIPSSCTQLNSNLICDLFQGRPMLTNDTDSISISYDVCNLEGTSMTLTAKVFSTGEEKTDTDNIVINEIALRELSVIEATGQQITPPIALEKVGTKTDIVNTYEIKNFGPSKINELEVTFWIPVAYKIDGITIPIVDSKNLTIQGQEHNGQLLPVDIYQKDTILLQSPIEYSTSTGPTLGNLKSFDIDMTKMGYSMDQAQQKINNVITRRSRRDSPKKMTKAHYTQITKMQSKSIYNVSDDLMGELPKHRTILFNCKNSAMTICVRAVKRVHNIKSGSESSLTVKMKVDLKEVNEILIEPWEYFVIVTNMDISKFGEKNGETINVTKKITPNIISKYQLYSTPIWLFIFSILGGFLLLAAIIFALQRFGFFKRLNKDKLEQLKRESQRLNLSDDDSDEDE